MYESGDVRLWEIARFNKLRGAVFYFLATDKNLYVCVCVCVRVCV